MKKQSRLVSRIVRPYLILLTVVLSAAVAIVYSSFVSRLRYETETAGMRLAETTSGQVDTFIEELDTLAEQVKRQSKITNTFYELDRSDGRGTNLFDSDILSSIDISSALKSLITDRAGNYNIAVYNECGDFVSSQDYLITKDRFSAAMQRIDYAYELERIERNGGRVVLPPGENPWTGSTKQFITLKKALKNEYSNDVCGIIEVRASTDRLAQMLRTDSGSEILICDRTNGRVIYPASYTEHPRSEYVTAFVEHANWEVMIRTASDTKINTALIVAVFVLAYIILLCFLFVIGSVIGTLVTKPIHKLAEYVRGIETPDDRQERVNDDAIDEIKELEESFSKMLERMNTSVTKEKKAYALALQAQMNPHFLYNMLAVISSAGIEAGCDNISTMCVELSDMLRYVTAYQTVTVPLKEELAHTGNYLSLMKSRYEELFTYSLNADESLLNMPVPKLIVQPLAENCFIHAFKEKEPPWHIDIRLTGTKDNWRLTIRDNGSGFPEERIAEIKRRVDEAVSQSSLHDIGGLGIVNTIARLTMINDGKLKYEIYNDNGGVIEIIREDENA